MNALWLMLALAAAPAAQKTKIAVLDLTAGNGITPDMATAVGAELARAIDGLGMFKAITFEDIRQMLATESAKQTLGCKSDTACIAEIGGALGADYVVSGGVLMFGQAYLIQLQLMNTKRARVEQRVSREFTGSALGLFEDLRTAARILLRDLSAQRSGELLLKVSEEGATIKIDGSIVGVSPLPPLQLAGGVHTYAVEKQGFIVELRDFEMVEKKRTEIDVALKPSEEFRRDYKKSATRMRIIAWVATGLGAAALGAGGAVFGYGFSKASSVQRDIDRYNASDRRTPAALASLDAKQRELATLDGLTLGLALGGAAALTTGIVLLVTGDDPHRYDQVELLVSPTPSGAAGALLLHW